jgi:hypothetical protein
MQNLVEWFGYAASVVVAVSLLMSSLIKLRWINMVGASMFAAYGLIIHAYPVALLNFAIACINAYYLARIYRQQDQFKLVPATSDSAVLAEFLHVHAAGIRRFFPAFSEPATLQGKAFFALRNAHVAGAILTRQHTSDTLLITLDYVIPEYRDFKIGRFVFEHNRDVFRALGVSLLASEPHSPEHRAYLLKMGFAEGRVGGRTLLVRSV